jgi:hypothetical protein
MSKFIEFVSSYDLSRSQLAAGFANELLRKKGSDYTAISSGVNAKALKERESNKRNIPLPYAQWLISMGVNRGIISDCIQTQEYIHKSLDDTWNWDFDKVQDLANKVMKTLIMEQKSNRIITFRLFDLGYPKEANDQFTPRLGVDACFGMTRKHIDIIDRAYWFTSPPRVVDTLAGYSFKIKGYEFSNAFGKSVEDYLNMAEIIQTRTRDCVKRFLDNKV